MVIGIWGLVIYNFVNWIHDSNEIPSFPHANHSVITIVKKPTDQLRLKALTRDPFFGTSYRSDPKSNFKRKSKIIDWPDISFKGVVRDIDNKKGVYLLIVDDQVYSLKKGETINNITLKSATNERVVVAYHGEIKVLTK